MSDDKSHQWMVDQGVSPRHKQAGRVVPPIPASLAGASMRQPIDREAAERFEKDFMALIECSGVDSEYDINARILDYMDESKITPSQAHKLLKMLFHKADGGAGMCRVDRDGNVHAMNQWEAKDGE